MSIKDALKNNNFDLLRLIFAGMVVIFHMALLSGAPELDWFLRNISSTFAVQAFFVVSGFLVTMSYEKSESISSYFSKRIRRIAPAYIFVVIAAAVLLGLTSTLPLINYFSNTEFWRYLGFNLLLSNFNAPSLPGVFEGMSDRTVNGSLWTIKIEVAFYCFVPLMVAAVRRYGYKPTLATIFLLSLAWKVGFTILANSTDSAIYLKLAKQLPGQLSFFMGGAWAYYRTREGLGVNIAYALTGVTAYALAQGAIYQLTAPFAVTAIVYWMAVMAPKIKNISKHGDFSYGIYLYHFPLVQVFISFGLFYKQVYIFSLMLILILFLISVASWNAIELPFLKSKLKKAA